MKKHTSVFDYTITLNRKHRYWVVSAPEFGFQVASGCLDLAEMTPENIGKAVLQVVNSIGQRLQDLEKNGLEVPTPKRTHFLLGRDVVAAREAAKILGVSRPTLRKLVRTGILVAQRTPGGHLRFSLNALSDYLLQSQQPAQVRKSIQAESVSAA